MHAFNPDPSGTKCQDCGQQEETMEHGAMPGGNEAGNWADPTAPMTPEEKDVLYFRATVALSLARLYDAMLVLIDALGQGEAARALNAKHAQGELFYPPPVIDIKKQAE